MITTVSMGKGWDSEVCLGVVTFSPQSAATGTACPQSACLQLAKCSNTPCRVELPEFTNSFGHPETAFLFFLFPANKWFTSQKYHKHLSQQHQLLLGVLELTADLLTGSLTVEEVVDIYIYPGRVCFPPEHCWSRLGCLLLPSPGGTLPSHAGTWSPPLCNRTNNSKWTQLANNWEAEICLPNSYEYRRGLFKKEPCLQTNCKWQKPKSLKLFVTNNSVSSMSLCLTLAQMGVTPFQSKQSSLVHSPVTRPEECSTFSVSICSDLKICLLYLCSHLSCVHELWTLNQSKFTPLDTYRKQN